MNIQKEIIRITSEYLKDDIDYLNLSDASKEYKSILNTLCAEEINIEEGRNDIEFENGKALGTFWAALCLDDLLRTRQFIRGIYKAIQDKLRQKKTIHILYAGTGPFATLLLPLLLRFAKEDIKYTFLEINPISLRILKKIIAKLDLQEYDITFVSEDATKYQLNSKNKPDIIISETMQNALAKEQQVPIFLNLMSQAKSETIFIPEKIELILGLKDKGIPMEKLNRDNYHKEETIFEVSKEAMFPANGSGKYVAGEVEFQKKKVVIENEKLKNYDSLVLMTEIQVYKEEKILLKESGLTTPLFMQEITENQTSAMLVDTQYKISSNPKLDYEISLLETV